MEFRGPKALNDKLPVEPAAFIRNVAGGPGANPMYMAQKEELEGDRSTARAPLRLELLLSCAESLTNSRGLKGQRPANLSTECWPRRTKRTKSCRWT